ncbi:MAG: hypothetical protein ACOC7W_05895 [Desulfosalsimonas sp.]
MSAKNILMIVGDYPVEKARVDGKPVTPPAWPARPQWLAKFLKALGTRIKP